MGFFYDFLLKYRQEPPISNEIVLIQTAEVAEGGDVFDVLMSLSEFNASALVITAPILGVSSDRTLTDEEIRQRLDDEYSLLARNIRNLFDAIRMGTVQPAEAGFYVDNLIGLADRGKDRLAAFFLRNVEPGSILATRDRGVFENVLEAADLQSNPPEGRLWYSRPRLDGDGKVRRVAPLLPLARTRNSDENEDEAEADETGDSPAFVEHIVYRALKPRWEYTGIEDVDFRQALIAGDFSFPLDHSGSILVEKPHGGDAFRVIGIEQFRAYTEADLSFRRQLKYAESLGAYSRLRPERIPLYLYDHAVSLQDDLLKKPSPEKHREWLNTRREYWLCLDEFLNGDSETKLLESYDELIAAERNRPESAARMRKLRDDLILLFSRMRESQRELTDMRDELATALNASFCIMGPPYAESPVVEASALLANTLLTGRCISAAQKQFVVYCSFGAVFILLLIIHAMRPFVILISGTSASLLCIAGFGMTFIYTDYWMYPQIPALACMAGTVAMFITAFLMKLLAVQRFRIAFRGVINKKCLKQLIRAGQPSLREIDTAAAAVVAVKYSGLLSTEDKGNPVRAAQAAAEFRGAVTQAFLKAGAALIGCEGDTVLVCFGSPPERIYQKRTKAETRYGDETGAYGNNNPATKAEGFITGQLIGNAPASWCFGMDYGECAFSWSKETGYIANGRPVVRARILASLAPKYKARILITDTVRGKVDRPARKLQYLSGSYGSEKDLFYELSVKP